jgi:hypothetical protein
VAIYPAAYKTVLGSKSFAVRDLHFLCECIIHVTALKIALDREQILVVCTSGDMIVEILKWFFGSLFNRFFYPLDVIPTLDSLNNVIRSFGAFDEVEGSYPLRCVVPSLQLRCRVDLP